MRKYCKPFLLGILTLTFIFTFLFGLTACITPVEEEEENNKIKTVVTDNLNEVDSTNTFVIKDLGEAADFHTETQKAYLNDYYENVLRYADGTKELSRPSAIVLKWQFSPEDERKADLKSYEVKVSEDASLASPVVYSVKKSELSLYNLKLRTDYYYSVNAIYKNCNYVSDIVKFRTTDCGPRNLYIDGISNCRDLGGYKTEDGDIVKQGLIFRTARLNQSYASTVKEEITAAGKKVMTKELGVKTEIELRGEPNEAGGLGASSASVLGNGVNYVYAPMRWNNVANLLMGNNEMTRRVFHVLSDENNYPVFYHCSIGTDRTGFTTILINGLLGVSEEQLYRDYLFSNFGDIGGSRSLGDMDSVNSVHGYMNFIKSYQGNTFAEKVYHFLVSIGVPSTELDSVISIMKENGNKPSYTEAVNVSAKNISHSSGIEATLSSATDAPEYYYSLNGKSGESITAKITSNFAAEADVYLYLASSQSSTKLSESAEIYFNGVKSGLPAKTFNELGCRDTAKTWVPVPVGTISLIAGENTITLTQISDKGATVASITLVSKNARCELTPDEQTYVPTPTPSCEHDFAEIQATAANGETAFTRYLCSKCNNYYNKIEAEACTYNINSSSNIKEDTIKLGVSGDWIELKVYAAKAVKATVLINASVSNSSSVFPVNSGLNVVLNGQTLESTASGTYASYGLTETVYADIPLIAVNLVEGLNTIRVNRYGNYGCTIDYIKVLCAA